ncbi:MAG: MATE family efflux transporter [Candidatus Zixiibacteriota bacterium]
MAKVQHITDGPIFTTILKLAWPTVAVMFLEFMLTTTDYFWLGYLGTPQQDALTSSMVVTWTIFAINAIIIIGLVAIVSRFIGAQEPDNASYYSKQGLQMAIGLGLIFTAVGIIMAPSIIRFMKAGPEVVALGTIYLRTFFAGIIFFYLNEALGAIFRASGDTRSPMIAYASGTVLNIFLDPLLIFGWGPIPGLGIGGAALATIISVFVGTMIFIALLFRGRLEFSLSRWYQTKPDFKAMLKMVRIGLPVSVQNVTFIIVYWFIIQLVHHYGEVAGAGMGIGNRMESLSYLITFGLSMAASTMVGQNMGAKKPDRAARSAWWTIGIGIGWTSISSFLFIVFPESIAGIFTRDPGALNIAADYLIILGYSQIFMATEIILEGAFSGAGDTLPPMIVSIPGSLARLPLAYYFCFNLNFGVNGVWWSLTITSFIKAVIIAFWFRKGNWKKKNL